MDTKVNTSSSALIEARSRRQKLQRIITRKLVLTLLLLFLVLSGQKLFAQGVGISETTIVPDPSAILELKHTSGTFKGFLTPRMAEGDRDGIASPATGLIIYNTTTNKLNIYDGTAWRVLFSGDVGINDIFGTADRITIDKADVANPIIDIANTYVGQASITTLGTITTGTWNASTLEVPYGGTGLTSITTNNLLYGNGTNAISLLAPDATTGTVLMNTAAGAPSWSLLSDIPNTGLTANRGVYTNATSQLTTTPPSSGTLGFWDRTGTVLSPSNAGDDVTTSGDISTSGTGTITSAGLLTANNGLNVTNTLQADDNVILGADNTDALTVNANADFNDNLNVDGATTTNGITNTGNISNSLDISTATLQTSGTATLNDATVNTTLDVTGATTLASTLDVTGTTTLDGTNGLQFDAGQNVTGIVTAIGDPGVDTNLPTEKAVRDAIAAEELTNGEGTSIGADGNSVDIGGGKAFTGSRTIDLDVNTLTIDPSAGGNFQVTGTTGNVTVDNTGNLDAGNGVNVTNTLQADDNVILGADNTDALTVNANADFNDNLNVDGATTTNGITNTGNISNSLDISTATLQTSGTATLNDATVNTTLDVTGATTLASTLDVTGTTTLDGTNGLQFDAGQNVTGIVTAIGDPGVDTNLPTEKAVRDAIAAEELTNGEGTSIGADGNSVDIGGGKAFTGSRTIDLDVNTLTIDPSAGGNFQVTGTTGNVTVDNTGNLDAGNGVNVTNTLQADDNVILGADNTDALTVNANADFNDNLNVDGATTTNGITNTGNISNSLDISTATLQTSGTATLNDATVNTTLDVTGATTLASTLDVTGTTTLDGTNGLQFDAGQNVTGIVTAIGDPGVDTNLPTEKAVRDAIAAEELTNGEGTSIGADGNSVDIGGGKAFTGSRTIDLDVNTLTIDPSAGGNFQVTGTTGNVTVDNTGNLDAGNGVNVTNTLQADDNVILGADNTDALTVNANADFNDNLNVDGATTTNGITNTGNISNSLDISTATLQTSGTATLNDATVNTTLDVTGATTLASTLDVTGTTTLDGTNGLQFDAGQNVTGIVTAIGDPGVDTNLPTEKAVRDAIAAEELTNGEGTSIGADGNSVDIGGGKAFTGSRTIDLDVNTLTIDPSAGGNFQVTGTTGNVTVDNTGNLDAGNGVNVTNTLQADDNVILGADNTDALTVNANADFNDNLNVDGATTTNGITNTGNISNSLDISTATLQTSGTATLNDATVNTTLDVTGATTLASTLDVTGTTTLDGTNGLQFDAGQNVTGIVTAIGDPGVDTNLPTEKAVRDAIAAEELTNGEGTSIGADGNSVDIGGGKAFTGSRTIDLDVNTLTIDPSAGGNFQVTGTTGNVTVDNTGNLDAGNGVNVTNTLQADDNVILGADNTDALTVNANADFNDNLNVDGATTTNGITNTGNISNSLDISTATLQTSGTATLNDATVNTTLDVTGATTLASTLDVTGTTTLDGTNGLQFDAGQNVTGIVTAIGDPGVDTNLPTEKAVRDAIAAEELTNGEGTSIGADGNSVDIGGGKAFTGSRTIDLDVNTLTIDPSAGGNFQVTGTTGNVTVDNTGNLDAGNGVNVTNTLQADDNVILGADNTDALTVNANADFNDNLNVDGATTTNGITNTGNISNSLDISTATLQTSGTATLNDATVNTTLDVTGATTLASTLDVTGTTTLDGTNGLQFDAGQNVTGIVTAIGDPGVDTNLPTEKAVRDAIAAEELTNGEGTSIGADGNSVDIGGGKAFTGSRTIDLDVNTLTIDPSAGGNFQVTGTTGNVTVDNTGNLDAGNGVNVTNTLQADDNVILGADNTDALTVNANADFNDNLNVDGATTTNGITNTGNISNSLDISTATLQTSGTATLNDATVNTTLDVTGATTLASTLDVTGTTTLDGTNGLQFDAGQNVTGIVTAIGDPGVDTNLPTEKAVRDAIAAEELTNGEGTSIGADGNSVDIGGGKAFTGSRTIDLDVNTLTIDPSAGGNFQVTGTTGNVTVDNTGNLDAGNGVNVTNTLQADDNVILGADNTDALTVNANADFNDNLNVDGATTTNGITNTGNISNSLDISTATLQTSGTATLNDATVNTTLDVTGTTTLASTLDVTGTTTLDGTNGLQFDAGQNVTGIVTAIGDPGVDTNLPTEKAVRDAIAAEELTNGEGTSIGADGNSVDIGGGKAFTGSRTIDLDVNTLTIDPSAGGNFQVTGTTGNVTVDNTGNLDAGNGVNVTNTLQADDNVILGADNTDALTVNANADFNDNLNVDGATTTNGITNTGNISNSLDISTATLQTSGTATLNDATVGTTLGVTGASTLTGGVTVGDNVNDIVFTGATNDATLQVADQTTNATTLVVRDFNTASESIAMLSDITAADEVDMSTDNAVAVYNQATGNLEDGSIIDDGTNVDINSNFTVAVASGNTDIAGTLDVTGTTTLGTANITTGTMTTGTITTLGGAMDANNQIMTNINIDGGAIDGTAIGANAASTGAFTTLSSSGAATLNSASITNAATVGTTLGVTGASTLTGGVTVGDNVNDIVFTGATNDATLQVADQTTNATTLVVRDFNTASESIAMLSDITAADEVDMSTDNAVAVYNQATGNLEDGSIIDDGTNVDINSNFTVAVASGNTDIAGTLDVTGTTTLGTANITTGTMTTGTITTLGGAMDANNQIMTNINIDGGAIDGTAIGANAASTGAFTTLSSSGAATLNSASITNAATVGTTLGVTGASTLTGGVTVGDNVNDIVFTGATNDATLQVADQTTNATTLVVRDFNTASESIAMLSDITAADEVDMSTDNAVAVYNQATGNLEDGSIIDDGTNVDINSNFTVAVASGNTDIAGTLDVTGTTTLGTANITTGTMTTGTITTLGGAMDANNQIMTNINIDGGAIDGTAIGANAASTGAFTTLSSSGAATLNSASITNAATVGTTLGVTGASTLTGGVTVGDNVNDIVFTGATNDATLQVADQTTNATTLVVRDFNTASESIAMLSDITAADEVDMSTDNAVAVYNQATGNLEDGSIIDDGTNVDINSNFTVAVASGNTDIAGTLDVTGTTTLGTANITTGTMTTGTITTLGGAMDANNQIMTNINIDGGAIDGTAIGANAASTGAFTTLSSSGAATLNSASITNAATVGTTLGVTGASTLTGGVTVGDNVNDIVFTGATNDATLQVADQTTNATTLVVRDFNTASESIAMLSDITAADEVDMSTDNAVAVYNQATGNLEDGSIIDDGTNVDINSNFTVAVASGNTDIAGTLDVTGTTTLGTANITTGTMTTGTITTLGGAMDANNQIMTNINIDGGAIDGTAIGANAASTGAFTTLSSSGAATLNSASITNAATVGTTLGVTGASTLTGGVTVGDNVNDIVFTGATNDATLQVADQTTNATTLVVRDFNTASESIAMLSDITAADEVDMSTDNAVAVYNQATGNLEDGSIIDDGTNVDINSNFTVAVASGNTDIAGTLDVTGTTTLGTANITTGTMTTGTITTLGGAMDANNQIMTNINIDGGAIDGTAIGANAASTGAFTTLSSSGAATLNSASITNAATVGTTLGVTGASTLTGGVTVGDNVNDIVFTGATNDATLQVADQTTNATTLVVRDFNTASESIAMLSDITAADEVDMSTDNAVAVYNQATGNLEDGSIIDDGTNVDINSNFTVAVASGNTDIAGTLDVTGTTTLGTANITTGTMTTGTITTLGGAMDANNQIMTNINIDGGAIDGTAIGANVASTGAFTTLSSSGAATLNSTSITNAATVGTTLDVTGASTLTGGVTVGDNVNDIVFTGATNDATLQVADQTTNATTLVVRDFNTASESIAMLSDITAADEVDMSTDNAVAVYNQATGNLEDGSIIDDGTNVDINSNFTVAVASGNTDIAGTLDVTGTTTLGTANITTGTMTTGTITTLGGAMDANNQIMTNINIDGGAIDGTAIGANAASTGAFTTLSSSGAATLNSTSITNAATVGTTLGVTGASTLTGGVTVGDNVNDIVFTGATNDATLQVADQTTNATTLVVRDFNTASESIAMLSDITAADEVDMSTDNAVAVYNQATGNLEDGSIIDDGTNVDINSNFTVAVASGNTDIAGTLDVTGTTTLGTANITTGTMTTGTITTLGGAMDANNQIMTNINIDGGAIDGTAIGANVASTGAFTTLSSSGAATLNSASITNAATVGTTLGVTGASTLTGGVTVGDNVNDIVFTGATNDATLQVADQTTNATTLVVRDFNTASESIAMLSDITAADEVDMSTDNAVAVYNQATGNLEDGSIIDDGTNVDINSNFTVAVASGNTDIAGTLDVTGTTTLGTANITTGTMTTGTITTLGGAMDANNQIMTNINIDGGAIDGTAIGANAASTGAFTTLSSSGAATLNSASITNAATVGTTLGVTGASTLTGGVTVGDNVNDIVFTGATNDATLQVADQTTNATTLVVRDFNTASESIAMLSDITAADEVDMSTDNAVAVYNQATGNLEDGSIIDDGTNVDINSNFTVAVASGNTDIAGTLDVTGTTTLGTANITTGTMTTGTITTLGGAMDANNQIMTNINIDGGAIDGTAIGASDIDVTGQTLTLDDDQISGDKVEGGTINAVTINTASIGTLGSALNANNQAITNVDINSGNIDGATIATSTLTQVDNVFTLQDDGDNSRQAQFELGSITAGNTRTYTFPDASGTIALVNGTSWNVGGNAPGGASILGTTDDSDLSIQTGTGALNLGADAADKTINLGNTTGATAVNILAGTGNVDVTGNLNATGGLDVTGGALTITNQDITQITGGQVTFAGNVDANAGLDVTGGVVNLNNDATANGVNIGTGTNSGTVTIGNANNNVNLPKLTASRPVKTDASKNLISAVIDLTSSNDVSGTLPVTNGGTGLSSTTANQLLYSSSANTIAGLATAANGVLTTDASNVPSITSKIKESNLPAGTMILLNADETEVTDNVDQDDIITYSLDNNNYSLILVEIEIAIIQNGTDYTAWSFEIQYGGIGKKSFPLAIDGSGPNDYHVVGTSVKFSGEQKTATTISVDVTAISATGTWYIEGFRVYGII